MGSHAANHFFQILSIIPVLLHPYMHCPSCIVTTFSLSSTSCHPSIPSHSLTSSFFSFLPLYIISPQNDQYVLHAPPHFHIPCIPYILFSNHATYKSQSSTLLSLNPVNVAIILLCLLYNLSLHIKLCIH